MACSVAYLQPALFPVLPVPDGLQCGLPSAGSVSKVLPVPDGLQCGLPSAGSVSSPPVSSGATAGSGARRDVRTPRTGSCQHARSTVSVASGERSHLYPVYTFTFKYHSLKIVIHKGSKQRNHFPE